MRGWVDVCVCGWVGGWAISRLFYICMTQCVCGVVVFCHVVNNCKALYKLPQISLVLLMSSCVYMHVCVCVCVCVCMCVCVVNSHKYLPIFYIFKPTYDIII